METLIPPRTFPLQRHGRKPVPAQALLRRMPDRRYGCLLALQAIACNVLCPAIPHPAILQMEPCPEMLPVNAQLIQDRPILDRATVGLLFRATLRQWILPPAI
jgi:hypothetical protein